MEYRITKEHRGVEPQPRMREKRLSCLYMIAFFSATQAIQPFGRTLQTAPTHLPMAAGPLFVALATNSATSFYVPPQLESIRLKQAALPLSYPPTKKGGTGFEPVAAYWADSR